MKASDRRAIRAAAALLDENAEVIRSSNQVHDGTWDRGADPDRLLFNKHQRLAKRLREIEGARDA